MSYFYAFLMSLVCLLWAYVYMKIYQLDGYKLTSFFDDVISFNFAFGDKNKLKFTKRLIRFIILYVCVIYMLNVLVFVFSSHWALILMDEVLLLIFTPVIMMLVHIIILPLELAIKQFYMKKAAKKLASKKCIKIGITGSYGKTSTKNILYEMLSKNYKVCVTPANFNTEMGITKTILEKLDDDDIFIAEMGARHSKDIAILTKLVRPDYGIITTIGAQHIETFKTLENIEDTKFELVENMKPCGTVVFNGDSASTTRLFKRCKKNKFLTCAENASAKAKDIYLDSHGSRFTLVIEGKEIKMKTRLLGKCNIDNIVTAAMLSHILGVSVQDIQDAVYALEPTPHRLELIKSGNISIIDDSYNSNLIGAREALEVLKSFNGRKIVVTPGFVEMGQEQNKLNFQLGAMFAVACDY